MDCRCSVDIINIRISQTRLKNYPIQTRSSFRILVSESAPCLVSESVATLVSESAALVSESAVDLTNRFLIMLQFTEYVSLIYLYIR